MMKIEFHLVGTSLIKMFLVHQLIVVVLKEYVGILKTLKIKSCIVFSLLKPVIESN